MRVSPVLPNIFLTNHCRYKIDAICINQQDAAERGQQVQIMKEIYAQADCVHIWLGPGSPATRDLIHRMTQIALDEADISIVTDEDGPFFEFVRIMKFAWWFRLWVVQEAILAKSRAAWIGDACTAFDAIIFTCQALGNSAMLGMADINRPGLTTQDIFKLQSRSLRFSKGQECYRVSHIKGLLSMFMNFQYCRCSDDRDHIYGMLGLLPAALGLIPDYSLAVAQVYERSCLAIMQWSNSLELLRLRYQPLAAKILPSWVCDFRRVAPYMNHDWVDVSDGFNACRGAHCYLSQPKPGALNVQMLAFDQIRDMQEYCFGDEHRKEDLTFDPAGMNNSMRGLLKQWHGLATGAGGSPSGESVAFWRTVATGKMSGLRALDGSDLDWHAEYIDEDVASRLDHWLFAEDESENIHSQLLTAFMVRVWGHTFFVTTKGYPGSATATGPGKGDTVAILAGLSCPVILREVPGFGSRHFKLVATCYCDGKFSRKADHSMLSWTHNRDHVWRSGSRSSPGEGHRRICSRFRI